MVFIMHNCHQQLTRKAVLLLHITSSRLPLSVCLSTTFIHYFFASQSKTLEMLLGFTLTDTAKTSSVVIAVDASQKVSVDQSERAISSTRARNRERRTRIIRLSNPIEEIVESSCSGAGSNRYNPLMASYHHHFGTVLYGLGG
jgi:hypothetical protein